MGTALELLRAATGERGIFGRLGRWMQYVSRAVDSLGGTGGCCMNGVILGNVGQQFTDVPLTCPQPDTNYIVTGVFAGGTLGTNEFAITQKTTTTFRVFITGGIPVGGLLMDFRIDRC